MFGTVTTHWSTEQCIVQFEARQLNLKYRLSRDSNREFGLLHVINLLASCHIWDKKNLIYSILFPFKQIKEEKKGTCNGRLKRVNNFTDKNKIYNFSIQILVMMFVWWCVCMYMVSARELSGGRQWSRVPFKTWWKKKGGIESQHKGLEHRPDFRVWACNNKKSDGLIVPMNMLYAPSYFLKRRRTIGRYFTIYFFFF